jgi:hypothetical protein
MKYCGQQHFKNRDMFQEFSTQTIYCPDFPDIFKFPSMKRADTGRQANI